MKKTVLALSVVAIMLSSCQKDNTVTQQHQVQSEAVEYTVLDENMEDDVTSSLVNFFKDENNQDAIVETLRVNETEPMMAVDLVEKIPSFAGNESADKFLSTITKIQRSSTNPKIYEIRIESDDYSKVGSKPYLFINADNYTEGDETIYGSNIDGKVVSFSEDTQETITQVYDLVIIEAEGQFTFAENIRLAQEELEKMNIKFPVVSNEDYSKKKTVNGLWEKSVLREIRLTKSDEEPKIKGKAEIYTVAIGINVRGQLVSGIAELPGVDYWKTTYNPNKHILWWNNPRAPHHNLGSHHAEVHIFEDDGSFNYQQLVATLVDIAAKVAGAAAGMPEIAMIGKYGSEIVKAIPEKAFLDGDDHVDSLNEVMKYWYYTHLYGTRRNARTNWTFDTHH